MNKSLYFCRKETAILQQKGNLDDTEAGVKYDDRNIPSLLGRSHC